MIFVLIILLVMLAVGIFLVAKNENAYRNQSIISYAIYLYRLDMLHHDSEHEVDFDDVESYMATFTRLWDWGYTRILPLEKYEIIKPYIEEAIDKHDEFLRRMMK